MKKLFKRLINKFRLRRCEYKGNTVFVISSKYDNGYFEVNAVYANEEKAKQFREWMYNNPLSDQMKLKEVEITEYCVL